ncbi:putative VWFA domain-containing protein [Candidatus Magnetomoraceae bacterium gMMP-15]
MKKICFITVIFLCIGMISSVQSQPLKMPLIKAYPDPQILWDNDNYKSAGGFWRIWANREGVPLFKSLKDQSRIERKTRFLESFYIFKKKGRFINIDPKKSCKSPQFWARIEDFIILNKPIQDKESRIAHKVVFVNQVRHAIQTQNFSNDVIPLSAPHSNAEPIHDMKIKVLDFAYIYGYYPPDVSKYNYSSKYLEYILIGTKPTISRSTNIKRGHPGSAQAVIKGWVEAKRTVRWKTREGMESNPKRHHPIFLFKDEEYLNNYYNNYRGIESSKPDKEQLTAIADWNKIDRNTWPPEAPRYLLRKSNYPNDVVLLAIPGAQLGGDISKPIHNLREQTKHIDLVFVIDATGSMCKYIHAVAKIANKIMQQCKDIEWLNSLRVGATVYRDYKDEDDVFDSISLTSDVDNVSNWLSNVKCFSAAKESDNPDAFFPEAVFQGLYKAATMSRWGNYHTRVIIHIGDTGNHSRGEDNHTGNSIGKTLVSNETVSYIAIHVNSEETLLSRLEAKAINKFTSDSKRICQSAYNNWLNNLKKNWQGNNKELENIIDLSDETFRRNEGLWYIREVGNPNTATDRIEEIVDEVVDKLALQVNLFANFLMGIKPDISTSKYSIQYGKPWAPQIVGETARLINEILGRKAGQLNCESSFYQNAFTKMKIDKNSPDQLIKAILFHEDDLEMLIFTLKRLELSGWSLQDPNQFEYIWIEMIKVLTGEIKPDFNKSLSDYYKMALGINFVNKHTLLSTPLQDIQAGQIGNPDEVNELLSKLEHIYNKLKSIQDYENRWFRNVSGEPYCWIKDELP